MTDVKTYKEKYINTKPLTSGGQATTLIGYENIEESYEGVLIKVLNRQSDTDRRARMHREYTILKTLNHDAIPKVIDSNTDYYLDLSYKLYISMEFVDGSTLHDCITKHGLFSIEEAIEFCFKVLDVIEFCHGNGIVHRDIKPDNIILRSGNRLSPVLVDFGLSFNSEDESSQTPDSHIIGNRFLFLPDLGKYSEERNDIRSDITMIVGLLFYVLTGIEPGHLNDQNNAMPHQRKLKIEDQNVIANLEKVSHIFDTGFQPNISHRFQHVSNLRKELELILEPTSKPENTAQRLSVYLNKKLSAHNVEKLHNEQMMREIESNLNKLFFHVASELKGTASLGQIKRSSGESSCWCAYSFSEKLSGRKMACVKLEANILGTQIIINGGLVELHGIYTGEKHKIYRIPKSDYKQIDYNTICEFLLDQVISHFESKDG